jgi:hypothetical protein
MLYSTAPKRQSGLLKTELCCVIAECSPIFTLAIPKRPARTHKPTYLQQFLVSPDPKSNHRKNQQESVTKQEKRRLTIQQQVAPGRRNPFPNKTSSGRGVTIAILH